MKKILLTITAFVVTLLAVAQSPNLLNYQGVARNAVGNVLPSQPIGLRLSILSGSPTGAVVYQETRNVTTNAFGLFNVQVGSPGAITSIGTIAGINWTAFGAGSGTKYLQVEIDAVGGTNYFNVGSTQLVSVPYSLYAGFATPVGPAGGDLLGSTYPNPIIAPLVVTTGKIADAAVTTIKIADGAVTSQKITVPFVKVQADAGALISMTNSGAGAGIEGINTGTGRGGYFVVNNAANTSDAIRAETNGSGASWGIRAISSGTNGAGLFQQTNATNTSNNLQSTQAGLGRSGFFTSANAANTANAVEINVAGAGAGLSSITTGTGSAGLFSNTNAANNASTVSISTTGTAATALSLSGPGIWGSAMGITNTTSGMEWRTSVNGTTYTVTKIPGSTFSPFQLFSTGGMDFSNSAGTSITRLLDNGNVGIGTTTPTTKLHVAGTIRIQDGTEALNKILKSDATGNASWSTLSAAGVVAGSGTLNYIPKWTPNGNTLGNSLIFDDGNAVGLGTVTPSHRFEVNHGGSTGIAVRSTASFSVVDIDAASGDAALRFYNTGAGQWNMRNRPGDNYLEFFELGGGGGSRMAIQDATGNVGIGNTSASIAYRLDVQHGGATGIRSKSTADFSVVDIDAASGDAALRFQKAGVGQWNTRNRPADDYYEIFELGGGGSRMVIQDGTGWVGIGGPGAVAAPAYQLDVEHGGATGIRSKSNASFSVVDIDAFSGDAALRFQKAGVGQWNTRNRPADDYYEIFELGGGGSRMVIQDATGNVGIGETTNPSYKLDVLHGGATGIRSRSSSSFSVVDIDAQSGDAALRFQKAGVNQWNVRNRPADDYFEIFELGGGGSRFVIQDATGNVGIGQTTAPAYKLDVLHGGSTGLRVQSSSSFSVVDIDGQSGDAALRFVKAGVNQWNTRNNPATDDYQIFELGGGGERMRIDNTTGKVWVNGDFTVVGVKAFTMDHPLDPQNKLLMHVAAESNEVINFYSGNVTTDASGKALVTLPDYFEAINKDFRYQLTVIGGTFAQAMISKEVNNNKFEIATNQPNVKVSWEVKGVRNDAHMQKFPFQAVTEKSGTQKGQYVDPAAYNQSENKRISFSNVSGSSLEDIKVVEVKAANPANTKGGSLEQAPITKPNASKLDNSGSVSDVAPTKPVDKKLTIDGSVAPDTKKQEVKPVAKPTGAQSING